MVVNLKLVVGQTYTTLEGIEVKLNKMYGDNGLGNVGHFSDGWNRYVNGKYIGKYCGAENQQSYVRHINPKCFEPPKYKQHQMTLL